MSPLSILGVTQVPGFTFLFLNLFSKEVRTQGTGLCHPLPRTLLPHSFQALQSFLSLGSTIVYSVSPHVDGDFYLVQYFTITNMSFFPI